MWRELPIQFQTKNLGYPAVLWSCSSGYCGHQQRLLPSVHWNCWNPKASPKVAPTLLFTECRRTQHTLEKLIAWRTFSGLKNYFEIFSFPFCYFREETITLPYSQNKQDTARATFARNNITAKTFTIKFSLNQTYLENQWWARIKQRHCTLNATGEWLSTSVLNLTAFNPAAGSQEHTEGTILFSSGDEKAMFGDAMPCHSLLVKPVHLSLSPSITEG